MALITDAKVALRQIDAIGSAMGASFAPMQNGYLTFALHLSTFRAWLKAHNYADGAYDQDIDENTLRIINYPESLKFTDKATYEGYYDALDTALSTAYLRLKDILNLLA